MKLDTNFQSREKIPILISAKGREEGEKEEEDALDVNLISMRQKTGLGTLVRDE